MRLVNADKYLKETCTYKDTGCGSCIFQGKCIADEPTVLELPDNPTNGDMIMALFPKVYVQKILDNNDEVIGFETYLDGGSQCFMADWWNAPYEKEIEE